ncbi:hypothetical protein IWW50_002807 [Coemansia erecta]|nr:hypothetical protein GGF43_000962 [Coemansia sp. RSA 2618]KAJ2825530.1 hypothetical protein IWW50_002807 [Coemansia erecta]
MSFAFIKEILAPSRLLGIVPSAAGVAWLGAALCCWHALQLMSGLYSVWAAYHVWMAVSACAGVYAQRQRDIGHAQWFALALVADVCVSFAYMLGEQPLNDDEQCMIARRANPGLSNRECLDHVHEIYAIAWVLRACVLALKVHLAGVANAFHQSLRGANQ